MNRVLQIFLIIILLLPLFATAQPGKPSITRAGSSKALTNMNFDKPDSLLLNLPKGSFITFVSYVKLKKNKNLTGTMLQEFNRDTLLRTHYPYNVTDFLDANGRPHSSTPGTHIAYKGGFFFDKIPDNNIQQLNDTAWQINFKYHANYDPELARLKKTYYDPVRNKTKLARHRVEKEADFLQPYSRYMMLIGASGTTSLSVFLHLHDYYKDPLNHHDDFAKALSEVTRLREQSKKNLYGLVFFPPLPACQTFFLGKLQPLYISIDQYRSAIETDISAVRPTVGLLNNNAGLGLLNVSLLDQQKADLSNTGIAHDSLVFLFNLVSKLYEADGSYFDHVLSGEFSLGDQSSLKPAGEWPEKIQNLQTSLAALNKLRTYINNYTITYLRTVAPATLDLQHLKENLNELDATLRKTLDNGKKINTAQLAIIDSVKTNAGFSDVSFFYASSFVQDLQTRGALSLTPDFGVISYGFTAGNQKFWGVTPYLGVQINVRPFDKNIPFSSLPRSYRKWYLPIRWSAMLGITFVSVKESGKRDNLFSGTNLLLGVGYKLTSEVRLTAGTMLFKKYDLNYVSSDTRLAATPYAGVSIDLDLKKFFSSITDVFIGK